MVILDSLQLPISHEETLSILNRQGFSVIEVDIIMLARQCIGTSQYRRGAKLSEAPAVVDCSSFVKWLYAKCGIWLPRRAIQQRELGEAVDLEELLAGDLVFVSGRTGYHHNNPLDGVGHVGIATGNGNVIHAAGRKANVVETLLDKFVGKSKFRGARRYIQKDTRVLTLETPANREVEIADDIKWIILRSLPKERQQ